MVPPAVLAPVLAQPLWSDQRLNIYGFGSAYFGRPWRLPVDVLGAVPYFLSVGNFRPLGRIYEWFLDVIVFALVDLLGVPADLGERALGVAAAIVLTVAAVRLGEAVMTRGRPFAGAPPVPVALLPFAIGAGFVAAGAMSTTVLFSGLYLSTGALILSVAAWACRFVNADRLAHRYAGLAVLTGAAIAAFNEMACLAVPLATIAVVLRGKVTFGLSGRALLRDPGVRFAALLWAGYLPVFLPVRAIIQANCARGGCYEGSAVSLTGAAATVPNRLVSWLPPLMWRWAADGREHWLAGLLPLLALIVLLVPAGLVLGALSRLPVVDRRQSLALAGTGVAVLGLVAAMASLNVWMQQQNALGHYGVGWRDSALATVGGSTMVLAALPRRRAWAVALLPVLVALGTVSAAANQAYHERSSAGRLPYLQNRLAQEIADFDRTAAGDARRCALRTNFLSTVAAANEPRIDQILDATAQQVAGRRFCSRSPVRKEKVSLYRAPAAGQ